METRTQGTNQGGRQPRDREVRSGVPTFPGRRSFLGVLLGLGTAGVGALLSVPHFRFALHPILAKTTETTWSDLGTVDEFAASTSPLKRLITIEQRDGWRKVISEK